MPVHRVPRARLIESIDALEADGEEVVWPPTPLDEHDVGVYTRPGRLAVNRDQLETRISGRLLGGDAA